MDTYPVVPARNPFVIVPQDFPRGPSPPGRTACPLPPTTRRSPPCHLAAPADDTAARRTPAALPTSPQRRLPRSPSAASTSPVPSATPGRPRPRRPDRRGHRHRRLRRHLRRRPAAQDARRPAGGARQPAALRPGRGGRRLPQGSPRSAHRRREGSAQVGPPGQRLPAHRRLRRVRPVEQRAHRPGLRRAYGTPVRAVGDGKIIFAGYDGATATRSSSSTPTAPSPGTPTWPPSCAPAAPCRPATSSAASACTGNTTGAHLHLEVRPHDGPPVPPLTWLRAHGVRI